MASLLVPRRVRVWERLREQIPIGLLATASALIVAMLGIILGNILWNGAGRITVEFLTTAPRAGMTEGGIFPAIFGTVALVLLMTLAAVPIGVATAIYLREFVPGSNLAYAWARARAARSWRERYREGMHVVEILLARATRAAVNNLAGVPSIVFGLFGLGFFVRFVGGTIDRLFYGGELTYGQPALIWAALTLALLTLPVVIVSTDEALRAVPRELREASLALGATRWQTIRHVVLPEALPGILTGAILAVSRGAGEVAPVLFTGAAYFLPYLPSRLNDQFMELGYHVFILSTQSPDVEKTKPLLYGTVLVLLALTFALNVVGVLIRARVRERLRARH
jgi:phosphate transport system permease protein